MAYRLWRIVLIFVSPVVAFVLFYTLFRVFLVGGIATLHNADDDESPTPTPSATADATPVVGGDATNPFVGKELYVNPYSAAANAVYDLTLTSNQRDLVSQIAEEPTAIWLTPESYPTGKVGSYVSSVVDEADSENEVAVFVIYGVPDRDCDGYASGGLDEQTYPAWVSEIADALSDSESVAILEPDALSLTVRCGDEEKRVEELSGAVDELAAQDVIFYIDAGHSYWANTTTMARMLHEVGIDQARGFSTNVSNYQPLGNEIGYADEIVEKLDDDEVHYVIDTGRNGAGGSGSDWCNPSGQALGEVPQAINDDSNLDAYLWVKPPGESDGPCNGGPASGVWWTDNAVDLATNAGWAG